MTMLRTPRSANPFRSRSIYFKTFTNSQIIIRVLYKLRAFSVRNQVQKVPFQQNYGYASGVV